MESVTIKWAGFICAGSKEYYDQGGEVLNES